MGKLFGLVFSVVFLCSAVNFMANGEDLLLNETGDGFVPRDNKGILREQIAEQAHEPVGGQIAEENFGEQVKEQSLKTIGQRILEEELGENVGDQADGVEYVESGDEEIEAAVRAAEQYSVAVQRERLEYSKILNGFGERTWSDEEEIEIEKRSTPLLVQARKDRVAKARELNEALMKVCGINDTWVSYDAHYAANSDLDNLRPQLQKCRQDSSIPERLRREKIEEEEREEIREKLRHGRLEKFYSYE